VEVPTNFIERLPGHPKMPDHIVPKALIRVWQLWFQNGCKRKTRAKQPQNG